MNETTILGHTIVPASELSSERRMARQAINILSQSQEELANEVDEKNRLIETLKADIEEIQRASKRDYNRVYELEETLQRANDVIASLERENKELKSQTSLLEAQVKDLSTTVKTSDCIKAIENAIATKKSKAEEKVSMASEVKAEIEAEEADKKTRQKRKGKKE